MWEILLISDASDLNCVQLWPSILIWLLQLWYNSQQNLVFSFSLLHMRTVPLNRSSMCWRWRHQDCRCSFICHFVLIYCAGQEEPPWAVVSQPGMLWCGEKAGQGRENRWSWTVQVKRVVCVHWIIMASRRPWKGTNGSGKVLTIFEDLRRVLIT